MPPAPCGDEARLHSGPKELFIDQVERPQWETLWDFALQQPAETDEFLTRISVPGWVLGHAGLYTSPEPRYGAERAGSLSSATSARTLLL